MVASRVARGLVVLAVVSGVALGGCSGSSGPSTPDRASSSRSSASGSSALSGSPSDVDAVRTAFVTFFNGKTAVADRIKLLQHGATFAAAIRAQQASGLAQSSSVTVSRIVLGSPDRAAVTYTVLLGGSPALTDQAGVAVRTAGAWQVSAGTFCALLTLEGQAPAPCHQSSVTSVPS